MRNSAHLSRRHELVLEYLRGTMGLMFSEQRSRELEDGVARVMKKYGLDDAEGLISLLQENQAAFADIAAEITIGETYFYREPAQFQAIREIVLPSFREIRPLNHIIRVWSAGCATGEEPYSLAIVMEEEGFGDRCHILATDVSRLALEKAATARYGAWSLRNDVRGLATRYFRQEGGRFHLAERFRNNIVFKFLNLAAQTYPSVKTGTTALDLILCRNVLIYFDLESVKAIAQRLYGSLADGGWLITGPSDPPLWEYAPFSTVITPGGVLYRRGLQANTIPVPYARGIDQSEALPAAPTRAEPPRLETAASVQCPIAEAEAAFRAGDHGRVVALTERLTSDVAASVLHIRALANLDRLTCAEVAASEATRKHPLSAELHYLEAVLLIALGRDELAVAALRRVIYLDRSLAAAHMTLGSLLRSRGDLQGALRAFETAYSICIALPSSESVPLTEGEFAGRLAAAAEGATAALRALLPEA